MNNDRPLSMFRTYLFFTPLLLSLAVSADGKSIGKDQVNIREHPDLKSAVLFTAPLGYPIKIKKENGKWLFFYDWQDNSGWVYKSLVSDIDTAVVLVDKANIRSAPRLDANVMASAEQGEIYTIIARDNNWVKLGYYQSGTAVGWIRDDLVFGE
jgi:SH3-like domain-containing protein